MGTRNTTTKRTPRPVQHRGVSTPKRSAQRRGMQRAGNSVKQHAGRKIKSCNATTQRTTRPVQTNATQGHLDAGADLRVAPSARTIDNNNNNTTNNNNNNNNSNARAP